MLPEKCKKDMKKFVIILAAAVAVIATSCSKEDSSAGKQSGEVDYAIMTSLPRSIGTYAGNSAMGGTVNVDPATHDLRFIMEVWSTGESPERIIREVKCVDNWSEGSASVTFNTRLMAKTYNFLFWADFVSNGTTDDLHYTTTSLGNVAFKGEYSVNDESRDAYYAKQTIDLTNQGTAIGNITLKRPFGKLRIISTDKPVNAGDPEPTDVKLIFGDNAFSRSFNVQEGKAFGNRSTHPGPLGCTIVKEGDTHVLAFDYILAADDLTALNNVKVEMTVDGETYTRTLPTIPVTENKLTTVKGNFYTNEGTFTVDVADSFTESGDDVVIEDERTITTVDELNELLDELVTNSENDGRPLEVVVNSQIETNETVTIPSTLDKEKTPEMTLQLPNGIAQEQTLLISGTDYDGTINISVPEESAGNLKIIAPNAHVVINGKYVNVTAKTSATTLVIEKGTTIESLSIEGGNVEIYGEVKSIATVAAGSKVYWGAGTAEELRTVLEKASVNDGVILTADIDGGNVTATQDVFAVKQNGYLLDGRGHTISGSALQNNVLMIQASNITVKDLTVTQTTAQKAANANNGITVYNVENIVLDNVTVENCGKAGVVINSAKVTARNLHTRGNAWGGVNVSKGTRPALDAAPSFKLESGVCEEVNKVWMDITAGDQPYSMTLPQGWYRNGANNANNQIYWSNDLDVEYVDPAWIADRSEPLMWLVGKNAGISIMTKTEPNNNWYSWHGLKGAVTKSAASTWSVATTLTNPSKTTARQSVWLNIFDNQGNDIDWCVIGYLVKEDGTKTWQWFDSNWQTKNADDPNKGWNDIKDVPESDTYAVEISVDGNILTQKINGSVVNTYELSAASTRIQSIIYNSYSYGDQYLTQWSYPVIK